MKLQWSHSDSESFSMNDKICLSNDPSKRSEALKCCSKMVMVSLHIRKFCICTETVWLIRYNVIYNTLWLKFISRCCGLRSFDSGLHLCVWCTVLGRQTPAVCSPCTVPPQRNTDWQSQLAAVIYRVLSAVGSPLPRLTHGMFYVFCLRNIHK